MANGDWVRVGRGNPCPVCEGTDKCAVSKSGEVCRCSRQEFLGGVRAFQITDVPFLTYTHRLKEAPGDNRGETRARPKPARAAVAAIDAAEVYGRFLALSPADAENREECQRRGINPDVLGYGSFPGAKTRAPVLAALVERFGPGLATVPGFVEAEPGRIDFAHKGFTKPALLVPCRNRLGEPVCLRMRNPAPGTTKNKWVYLSGGKHYDDTPGASSKPATHWARLPQAGQRVLITEGERKADTIAAHLKDFAVVSVPGAATWKVSGLVEDLEALEVGAVVVAYDSDLWENKDVCRGFLSLFAALEEKGAAVAVALWDKQFKGMDDALTAGAAYVVRSGDDAEQFRRDLAKRHGMTPAGLPGDSQPDGPGKPVVYVDWAADYIHGEAVKAVAADPDFFMREGKLIAVAATDYQLENGIEKPARRAFVPVCRDLLAGHLDRAVTWVRETRSGTAPASCPAAVAGKVLAAIGVDDGPVPRSIFGITQGPTLTLEGDLVNANGYQRIGGLGWWMEGAIEGLETRLTEPTGDPRDFAFEQIEALRKEGFPYLEWADPGEDWAKFVSFLFALILRPSLEKVPFHLISGNAPGSGKGILAAAAHRIAYGAGMSAQTWPERADTRDEILAKEIVNAVEAGQAVYYFDDFPQGTAIASKELDKLIGGQGDGISARAMQQNSGRRVGGRSRMICFGCGNNVGPNDDFGRRCVTIRIETRTPDPATRDPEAAFKGQGDLTRWVTQKENREKCLIYAINALRAYLVYLKKGGKESGGKMLGGFYDYSRYCSGAVLFATGIDPLGRMAEEIRGTESAGGLAGLITTLEREGILTADSRKSSLIKDMVSKIEESEIREDIFSLFASCGHRGRELTARGIAQVLSGNKNKPILIGATVYKICTETDRKGFSDFWISKAEIGGSR